MSLYSNRTSPESSAPLTTGSLLRANVIGVGGLIFAAIVVTAPLTAMASNMATSIAFGVGIGTVGVLLLVAAIYLTYSVGYVRLSKTVVNAAAYYAYVGYGLGQRAGAAVAMCAAFFYVVGFVFMSGLVGYFGSFFFSTIGLTVPWWVVSLVALACTWWIGYRGLSVSSRVNTIIGVLECGFVIALAVAVLIQQPGGWSLDVLAPANVFGGTGSFAITFLFCILTFTGFEAAASLAEETRDAKRTVGRAVFISLAVLTFFFVLGTWTMIAGAGADVVSIAQADPGALLPIVTATYLGEPAAAVLVGMITFSFFAAQSAFYGFASRYVFSLGREGYLPRAIGRSHPVRQTPVRAGSTVAIIVVLVLAPFAVSDVNPLIALNFALAGPNTIAIIVMMTACCASIVRAALTGRLPGSRWAVVVAPIVAGTGFLVCAYFIVTDYATVTDGGSPLTLIVLAALIVYGWIVGGRMMKRKNTSQDAPVASEDADRKV